MLISLSTTLFSCDTATTSAKTDSSQTALQKDTVPFAAHELKGFFITTAPSPSSNLQQIIYDSVLKSRALIQSAPPVYNDAGSPVQGFLFNSTDYQNIAKLKPASLYFEFGIHNIGDSIGIRNHTIKPQYTLMVLPLDANKNVLKDKNGKFIAYDYVCPCSNGVGCCPAGL
jgi:hypothetical protein